MSWVEKNWKPLTVVGGLLGLSWFAGKRFEEAETFEALVIACDYCGKTGGDLYSTVSLYKCKEGCDVCSECLGDNAYKEIDPYMNECCYEHFDVKPTWRAETFDAEEMPFGVHVKNHKTTSTVFYKRKPFRRFRGSRHKEKAESYAQFMEKKIKSNPNRFSYFAETFEAESYETIKSRSERQQGGSLQYIRREGYSIPPKNCSRHDWRVHPHQGYEMTKVNEGVAVHWLCSKCGTEGISLAEKPNERSE